MDPRDTLHHLSQQVSLRIDTRDFAVILDEQDPLAGHRSSFLFPKRHLVATWSNIGGIETEEERKECFLYFCGNSLGLQHHGVLESLQQELGKWGNQAVEGHFLQPNPWFEIDDVLRDDMAKIVGAQSSEVVIMNSLTVNLHLLLTAFYRPMPGSKRHKILAENCPFPSDTHAFVSQIENRGFDARTAFITVGGEEDEATPAVISTDRFLDAIERHGDDVAILVLGAVHFLTGQLFDVAAITRAAHAKGILVGVDAAHAAGNVPLQLHDWGVDFACWCTYKYLNGGPGSIAAAFVHSKHTDVCGQSPDHVVAPLRGWWGSNRSNRFNLSRTFQRSEGAAAFQLSNPSVVSIAALSPSVRLCASIGLAALRSKSLLLTAYLESLLLLHLPDKLLVVSPRDPQQRGAQLSVRIVAGALQRGAKALSSAYACGNDLHNDADLAQRMLLDRGVMCDNRPPDLLRLTPVPTYNSFIDVFELVEKLRSIF